MRKGSTAVLILVAFAIALSGCGQPARGSVSGLTFVLTGLSFGAYPDGDGFGPVPIKIITADGSVAATVTANQKGRFHADLPPGRYVLRASCGHGIATAPVTVSSNRVAKAIIDCSSAY